MPLLKPHVVFVIAVTAIPAMSTSDAWAANRGAVAMKYARKACRLYSKSFQQAPWLTASATAAAVLTAKFWVPTLAAQGVNTVIAHPVMAAGAAGLGYAVMRHRRKDAEQPTNQRTARHEAGGDAPKATRASWFRPRPKADTAARKTTASDLATVSQQQTRIAQLGKLLKKDGVVAPKLDETHANQHAYVRLGHIARLEQLARDRGLDPAVDGLVASPLGTLFGKLKHKIRLPKMNWPKMDWLEAEISRWGWSNRQWAIP